MDPVKPGSVILTRSEAENRRIAPCFEQLGMNVHSLPMILLRPLAADACGLRSVRRIAGGEPVLLTSAFATDLWLDLRETDFREHPPAGYYVVGRRSAKLLEESDPHVPIMAVADSGAELLQRDLSGVTELLYPCSTERRDELVDGLSDRGVNVVELPLYTPSIPPGAAARARQVLAEAERPSVIAFFSPSAVANFVSLRPPISPWHIFAAVGPTTADALRAAGLPPGYVSMVPSAEALAAELSR